MIAVRLSAVKDFDALGEHWRALESRAHPSFFQSWTWIGCLAAERFPDPVLVEARDDGRVVALALFNRTRRYGLPGTLFLHETGDPVRDRLYVEYNGVLAEAGREAELTVLCLRAARSGRLGVWPTPWPRRVVLSGVDDTTLTAAGRAGGRVCIDHTTQAPFAELAGAEDDPLAHVSANTRQQVRRSNRAYGAPTIHRAETRADAHAALDALIPLHQTTWNARGRPGCFEHAFFGRFHHELIDRGFARGEIELMTVSGTETTVGILYNYCHSGRCLAYQSGFDYSGADHRRKPGMTSHALAIQLQAARGKGRYDFLAGGDRYKISLSHGADRLHWASLESSVSLRASARWLRRATAGRNAPD